MASVVRYNRQCLINHGESHTGSLYILYSIKYAVEYLFGTCWLFVISNISPPYLPSLLTVIIMKPSGCKIVHLRDTTLQIVLWWTENDYHQMIGRPFSKYPSPWIWKHYTCIFLCGNEREFIKNLNILNWTLFIFLPYKFTTQFMMFSTYE